MRKALVRTSGNRISSFSTIIGITLVLTMLGSLFVFLLVANAVTRHFREELTVQVMLHDGAAEADVLLLKKRIEGEPYAGSVAYTSADEAARMYQQELGEEFVEFLGFNPIPASLDIHISPDFSATDSLEKYVSGIGGHPLVREVVYQKGLLQQVNENIARWGLGLLILGVLFLVIAVVLIVNTIELAIFSQRFIIKSMQLVGATHWFIQKPFLQKGLWYGFVSSVLALSVVAVLLYAFRQDLPAVVDVLMEKQRYLLLVAGIFGTGLLLSWGATAWAVRRFVRLRQEDLY